VSLGAVLSAAFIMAANSWMRHPVGYVINHKTGKPQVCQAWTYCVFRQRLSPGDFRPPRLLTRQGNGRAPGAGPAGAAGPGRARGPGLGRRPGRPVLSRTEP